MTVRGPDANDRIGRQKPDCTTSSNPVRFDLAVGAAGGAAGVIGGLYLTENHELAGNSMIVAGIALFLGFYTSAAIGHVRTNRCQDAIAEWNFRVPDSTVEEPPEH
jgi:hypothetical protein